MNGTKPTSWKDSHSTLLRLPPWTIWRCNFGSVVTIQCLFVSCSMRWLVSVWLMWSTRNFLLNLVARWSSLIRCSPSSSRRRRRYWSSHNSPRCWPCLKITYRLSNWSTKRSPVKWNQWIDRMQSIDSMMLVGDGWCSYSAPRLVVRESILPQLKLWSFMIAIGTHRMMFRQQLELIESVKRRRWQSTDWSLRIPMNQRCLKEQPRS